MQVGKVTKLFHDQEYGSIKTKSGEEVHFHKYCLWNCKFDELYESQEVEFEMQPTHKGYLGFEIHPFVQKKSFKLVNGVKNVKRNDNEL